MCSSPPPLLDDLVQLTMTLILTVVLPLQLDLKAVQDGMADPQGRTEEQIKQEVQSKP